MGMFDYVNFTAPCWKCGTVMTRWQSKDVLCGLETLEPWEVQHFYESCSTCFAWNEYKVVRDGPVPPKPVVPYHVVLVKRPENDGPWPSGEAAGS